MAITTYEEALAFANSPEGKKLPDMDALAFYLKHYKNDDLPSKARAKRAESVQYYVDKINAAAQKTPEYLTKTLKSKVFYYLQQYQKFHTYLQI